MEGISLHRVVCEFSQDGNTDGTTSEVEELTIDCESLWMNTKKTAGDCYFVLRTDGWSINDASEIESLISVVQSGLRVIQEELLEE